MSTLYVCIEMCHTLINENVITFIAQFPLKRFVHLNIVLPCIYFFIIWHSSMSYLNGDAIAHVLAYH